MSTSKKVAKKATVKKSAKKVVKKVIKKVAPKKVPFAKLSDAARLKEFHVALDKAFKSKEHVIILGAGDGKGIMASGEIRNLSPIDVLGMVGDILSGR